MQTHVFLWWMQRFCTDMCRLILSAYMRPWAIWNRRRQLSAGQVFAPPPTPSCIHIPLSQRSVLINVFDSYQTVTQDLSYSSQTCCPESLFTNLTLQLILLRSFYILCNSPYGANSLSNTERSVCKIWDSQRVWWDSSRLGCYALSIGK